MTSRGALALAAGLAATMAAGCAVPLKIAATADPLAILGSGAMAYLRLSGAASRELAPSLLPAAEAKSLAPLLARTRVLALALGAMPGSEADAPPIRACLIGDYPFRSAALSLGADPGWKREKAGYFNARLGLRAALPGPNLVLASSGALEPLLAAAREPGPSPIPAQLSGPAGRELALWLPEPFSGLVASLLGEAMDVPARGLLVSASPLAEGGGYDAAIVFLMEDADGARVYRPALRLAWYAIARSFFGDEADAALGATFSAEGNAYGASGVRLSGVALARVLAALRDGSLGAGSVGTGLVGGR